ncbi:MAG: HAD-IIB family hydrolase [Thermaerobacter sp.]|nr:HAD-IIB family hydrolase [Thermaerobacter sp.]
MIACDLDGTLLDRRAAIRPRSARLLGDLAAMGLIVVLATGRSWRTAVKIQRQIGLAGPIIAHNGACVFDPATGQELYRRGIPFQTARSMVSWADPRRIMLRCYLGYDRPVLFNRFDAPHQLCWLRPEDRLAPALAHTLREDPVEVFLSGRHEVDAFIHRFGLTGPDYELTVFPHPGYREVNICAPQVDKAEALDALARRCRIASQEVLALGDGLNDVNMLQWAGVGIAIGDGPAAARTAGAYVTPAGDDEPVYSGLSWAIVAGLLPNPEAFNLLRPV